jgi:dTDP-4-amino-4,6-dideoxygalactose transaminase
VINVTKTFLPPIEEYEQYIRKIWERAWVTNNGPLVVELEEKLKAYSGNSKLLFLGNGTIAIQLAIKALGLKNKIITTPFSYVATTSSIVWEGCTPVFADIDPGTLNIDPEKIEALIDKDVTAILATHCFGNACNINAIAAIAKKHNLKVIYDAAHCFGTTYEGKSIFEFGDISTTSFHATKLFHTIEGGAVFTPHADVHEKLACMRSFGYKGPIDILYVGINGKNSEMHAAMGLCNLNYIDEILAQRKKQFLYYDHLLEGTERQQLVIEEHCGYNYSYYPLILESEEKIIAVKNALEKENIFTRRYFSPSLSSLDYVKHSPTPVCDDISKRILCLPIFHDLTSAQQEQIVNITRSALHGKRG